MKLNTLLFSCAIAMAATVSCKGQSYEKTASGLEYRYEHKGTGTYVSKPGDMAKMHITYKLSDSTFFDSHKMNNNQPVDQPLQKPTYSGDVFEGLLMMKDGDKMIFRLPAKTFFEAMKQPMPEWVKPEGYVTWDVEMVSVRSKEKVEQEQKERAAKQNTIDDGIIQKYLKDNKIVVKALPKTPVKANPKVAYKDASGIYYIVQKTGTALPIGNGKKVSVNYTGKLLDGTVFDSNEDPKFNHVQPIEFTVGQKQMILGWDIMVSKMKVGDKVTAILPSSLAYGERAMPGSPIKENSVLLFDIDLLKAE
ncbi:Outer membrane protein MIP precursor [compost metagenome]